MLFKCKKIKFTLSTLCDGPSPIKLLEANEVCVPLEELDPYKSESKIQSELMQVKV